MNSRRSWLVWGVAVFAYTVAVLQRSSLGVAGVDAAERFQISASALSTLAVVQLVVYAALQVPVGVLLDRFGPKSMIVAGSVLMAAGQAAVAVAPVLEVAVVGRVLVGAGDAFTFISVIRLLSTWFSGRILPQASQWTGNVGQLGQVLSAIPFSLVLHLSGWTSAFLSAAAMSVLAVVIVAILVIDAPPGAATPPSPSDWHESRSLLSQALQRPGTRLGFWSHFVSQSPATMFTLLWGFPILTAALGYSPAVASGLLTLIVVSGVLAGPVIGILSARFPMRRSNIVLGIVTATAACWAVVLLWPDRPPFAMVVVLLVVLGAGGPGSLIGFDFARTFNPMRSLGSANGIVNVGGFLASFVMMFAVGLVLDAVSGDRMPQRAMFSWEAFRIALTVQYLVVGVGVVMLVRARRATRARLHEDEGIEVAPIWIAVGRAWRRRHPRTD